MNLTDEQNCAVNMFQTNGFCIINGGPGTGKTTLVKHLIVHGQHTYLMSPTGGAAERLHTSTGLTAHVYDKVLYTEYLFDMMTGGNIVLDEASMFSQEKLFQLLRLLKPRRLCLIGDVHQLPPVQVRAMEGTPIFATLMAASRPSCTTVKRQRWDTRGIPCVVLTKNLRQRDGESGLACTIAGLGRIPCPIKDVTMKVVITASDKASISESSRMFTENPNAQIIGFTGKTCLESNKQTAHTTNTRVVCCRNLYCPKTGVLLVGTGMIGNQVYGDQIVYDNGFVD